MRRLTIGKRMRAKLRQIRQELHQRMHDPVSTGKWLQSVVRGYFNYYTVPGNLDRLAVFRDRLLGLLWRSRKDRFSWIRVLVPGRPGPREWYAYRGLSDISHRCLSVNLRVVVWECAICPLWCRRARKPQGHLWVPQMGWQILDRY